MSDSAEEKARAFLELSDQFRLGELPTESRHPKTANLSEMAARDLPAGIAVLKEVDLDALAVVEASAPLLEEMRREIRETLARGSRIFLCGCGATGRLSLSLEFLWRGERGASAARESVISFMAGGDAALIRSVENFEDFPEYGARQLEDLGFREGDLLIASTEGGETPFVIGAAERAAEISSRAPFFLYCNPDEILSKRVERSRRALANPRIRKINLFCGPMALSGSTRMQASTVLMLSIGLALLDEFRGADLAAAARRFRDAVAKEDFSFLAGFVEAEAVIYERGEFVLYETSGHAITVLTDTTERSPTFSLAPFENRLDPEPRPSPAHLVLPDAKDSEEAWRLLLLRPPRAISWKGFEPLVGLERLHGFDFSAALAKRREKLLPGVAHHRFRIVREGDALTFSLGERRHAISAAGLPALFEHLLLKLVLNIHSTLVMGRLGRYRGNLMTYVKPSNRKLVDRAIRYVEHLLRETGVSGISYEEIARQIFRDAEGLRDDEPIVLKTLERFSGKRRLA